ncbi:MAG: tRNA pseudouridine synthase B [candidate division WS6 bacterium 36_33]|uniref:tRNA pseudouridine synthase B n=1 Tax=candidate division WS6 bacterium 36_33 TaxID=1641388 RepID=A0A101GYJ9_9BACT|nr:MAG: tRNA pseudouridine synthase B [candidate division WS6 bacterium 36_33]
MIDGILLINKEAGITSYDVIRRLKKILPKGQKIGHAGTLDPFATGLLIILLGKYTKRMVEILEMEKEYVVIAEFGYATDTQDVTGKKIKEAGDIKSVEEAKIEELLKENFIGEINQIPPQFSAKKIKGRKAYEFAREGKKVELKSRKVRVSKFEILNYNWPIVSFKIVCSSGTYIRTLINDLGELLRTYATAIELKRTRIGEYTLEDALKSEEISKDIDLNLKLIT